MVDNRKHERGLTEVPIFLGEIGCKTFDLSLGGAKCYCTMSVPTLEEIDICLKLPEKDLWFRGTALRCEETVKDRFEIGVFFKSITMSDNDRIVLANHLEISV